MSFLNAMSIILLTVLFIAFGIENYTKIEYASSKTVQLSLIEINDEQWQTTANYAKK